MSKTYAQQVIAQSILLKTERNSQGHHGDYCDFTEPDEGEHESVHGSGYHADYFDAADSYAIPEKTLVQKIVCKARSVFQHIH